MRKFIVLTAIAALSFALAPAAQADIITVAGITASSDYYGDALGQYPGMWMSPGVIDGNGLDVTGLLHSQIGGDNSAGASNMWFSGKSTVVADQWLQIDLGGVYDISSMNVWNEYEGWPAGRGTNAVVITYGTEITGSMAQGTVAPITSPGTLSITNFAQAPATNPFTGETFTEAFTAQYILFDIGSNYGGISTGEGLVGLAEVQFDGVPEPATMSLLAIGGLALIRRRRRA